MSTLNKLKENEEKLIEEEFNNSKAGQKFKLQKNLNNKNIINLKKVNLENKQKQTNQKKYLKDSNLEKSVICMVNYKNLNEMVLFNLNKPQNKEIESRRRKNIKENNINSKDNNFNILTINKNHSQERKFGKQILLLESRSK